MIGSGDDAGVRGDASIIFVRSLLVGTALKTVQNYVNLEERTHLFVVSIWWERRDVPSAPPLWRGSIQYERTGQRLYFRDVETLLQFLQTTAGIPVPSRLSWRACLASLFKRLRSR